MNKPLKTGAIAGIVLMVISLIGPFFNLLPNSFYLFFIIPFLVVSLAAGILYNYAFVVLGDKFDSNFLKVLAWIRLIFGVVFVIFSVVLTIIIFSMIVSAQESIVAQNVEASLQQEIENIFIFILVVGFILAIIYGIFSILWGIALTRGEGKVSYAKVTGILYIVAGATYWILIGFVIAFVARIFEIILLFNASEVYENKLIRK